MEISIAVCDDLPEERVGLAQMIRACCQERQVAVRLHLFSSGEELLCAFRSGRFHIIFLDIYMAGLSGMEAAHQIRERDRECALIFATTSHDYGIESFEVQASDYLLKPFQQQDVDHALEWCLEHLPGEYRCLSVCSKWEQVEIPLRSVEYIEIRGHQAHIHTDESVITARRGMDELEEELSGSDFLRCHRSFLVNLNHIGGLEGSAFRMDCGDRIPIGSSSAAWVREQFISWTFVKTWRRP